MPLFLSLENKCYVIAEEISTIPTEVSRIMSRRPADRVRMCRVGSGRVSRYLKSHGTGRVGSGQEVFKPYGSVQVTPTQPGPREMTRPVTRADNISHFLRLVVTRARLARSRLSGGSEPPPRPRRRVVGASGRRRGDGRRRRRSSRRPGRRATLCR